MDGDPVDGDRGLPVDGEPADRAPVDSALLDDALTASRALLGAVARSLAGALDQVTLPQFRVLVLLATRGPQRSGDLARAVGVHPSTFSRSADRLVAGGWVRRVDNPESRREVLVELTPQGADLVDDVTARRRRELAEVLGRATPEQRDRARAGFAAYARAAGETDDPDLLVLGL